MKAKVEGCLTFFVILIMIGMALLVAIATVEGFVYMFSGCNRQVDTVYIKENVCKYIDTSDIEFENEWAKELEKYE